MIIDRIFKSNLSWLKPNTIFLTRHGSHAYGLNIETSDEDFKGIAIPPREYFLGFQNSFEQAECKEPDSVIYNIIKFFKLAKDCNPNIIEVLWADDEHHIVRSKAADILLQHRDEFLSKKIRHTFSGYAISQLKRINVHYKWLKNPPLNKPTRQDFGLPEVVTTNTEAMLAVINKDIANWDCLTWSNLEASEKIDLKNKISNYLLELSITKDNLFEITGRKIGFNDNVIELLKRENEYNIKLKEWNSYQHWVATRNAARSAMESKFGYDTKHAMHLVRLLRMCEEILTTGKINVKRSDREELLAIRSGAWTYDQLVEWADNKDKQMDEFYKNSCLPHSPDVSKLDKLCVEIVQSFI